VHDPLEPRWHAEWLRRVSRVTRVRAARKPERRRERAPGAISSAPTFARSARAAAGSHEWAVGGMTGLSHGRSCPISVAPRGQSVGKVPGSGPQCSDRMRGWMRSGRSTAGLGDPPSNARPSAIHAAATAADRPPRSSAPPTGRRTAVGPPARPPPRAGSGPSRSCLIEGSRVLPPPLAEAITGRAEAGIEDRGAWCIFTGIRARLAGEAAGLLLPRTCSRRRRKRHRRAACCSGRELRSR